MSDSTSSLFIDRDASLMAFERRVLEEALDDRHPLLERVKFLGILGRNLDEFVMVRGKEWLDTPYARPLRRSMCALLRSGTQLLRRRLVPLLAEQGIQVRDDDGLSARERERADWVFTDLVRPALTRAPVGDTQALGLNFVVVGRDGSGQGSLDVVRVPDHLPAIIALGPRGETSGSTSYVWLDQLIARHLHQLFPESTVVAAHRFRMLRDADVNPDPSGPCRSDASARMIEALRQRQTNPVMMLEIDRSADEWLVEDLCRALSIDTRRVTRTRRMLDLKRLWDFSIIARPDLRDRTLTPRVSRSLSSGCLFDAIRSGDILLHHPYESFQPVLDLLWQAAHDPDVRSISTTIYRTDREPSPVVDALVQAARAGKRVRVVVELKARFDERRNAECTRQLREAGASVTHGRPSLKIHAKQTVIVRREGDRTRRYAHISTGNYSTFTSMVYTDFALLTCDDDITSDAADLFDFAAGDRQTTPALRRLLAAPFALRDAFAALVEQEIAWTARGERGRIVLKMNALVDHDQIKLLYRASQAGVEIDLIVRGICCLRPGVPGLSDRIRVKSIVGRFLEHSRAWYFRNGGRHDVFVGSADIMPRNFDRRVEMVVPIRDHTIKERVRDILETCWSDTKLARELQSSGRYVRFEPARRTRGLACQELFLLDAEVDQGPPGMSEAGVGHQLALHH